MFVFGLFRSAIYGFDWLGNSRYPRIFSQSAYPIADIDRLIKRYLVLSYVSDKRYGLILMQTYAVTKLSMVSEHIVVTMQIT